MPDRRVVIASFVFVVVIGGSWAAAHFVRPIPEARWTNADLPTLPPERDNVYALLAQRITFPDVDTLIIDDSTDFELHLEDALRLRDELDTALAPTEALRDEVRQRPRFVESGGLLGQPHVLEGMALWKLRQLAVLQSTMNGEHERAAEEVASMWTHAVDYASHCQSMVSCMAGQRLLQLTLGASELLANESPLDLRWLARVLESSVPARSAIANGIIAEYVYARVSLETYDAPLLDRAHTDAMLANHYERALAFAHDASNPRPTPRFRDNVLWWLYNPAGKRLASITTVQGLDSLIERYGREADDIVLRRDHAVASLRSTRRAAYRAAFELPCEDPGAVPALDSAEIRGCIQGQ